MCLENIFLLPKFYILHFTFYTYHLSFALQRFGEAAEGVGLPFALQRFGEAAEGGGGGDGADRRKRVLRRFAK